MGLFDGSTSSDTGLCIPESRRTLELQQEQLKAGKRDVQMFPVGTRELPLPDRLSRFQNERGVFHFHADRISADEIARLSAQGRENVFLMLGPYSKPEIIGRFQNGERLFMSPSMRPMVSKFGAQWARIPRLASSSTISSSRKNRATPLLRSRSIGTQ
jgi:hypothetical protein